MEPKDILSIVGGIVVSLGGGAVIVFALSNWLGKLWAERLMAAEQARHSQALECLRSELRKKAFECEVRFTKLQETRVQIIADLYAKLVALVEAADQHLIDPRTDPAKQDTYRNCEQDFLNTYSRSEIYFPLELCDALSSFASKLHHSNMEKFIFQASQPLSPADCDEWSSRLKARYRLVTEEVPCLKRKLTDEFRHLLGVNSPDNARA